MTELARPRALLTVVLSAGLAIACSGSGSVAAQPDPAKVLRDAGQAMTTLKSVKADVKFGSGVTLQGFTLSSATSTLQLPDQSDTTFKVKQGDFLVDVRVVSVGGRVYLRLPFSQFQELSVSQAAGIPNLSKLLDPNTGLASVLGSGKDPKHMGSETIRGAECDKVTATYTAGQIGKLMGGATVAGDVRATIWAGRSDHQVRRVTLSGPLLEPSKDVEVQVDLHDFNQPVTITSPTMAAQTGG